MSGDSNPVEGKGFLVVVENDSGFHLASCLTGTSVSFAGGNAAGG